MGVILMYLTHTESHQDICSCFIYVHHFRGANISKMLLVASFLYKCLSSHWEIGINLPKYCFIVVSPTNNPIFSCGWNKFHLRPRVKYSVCYRLKAGCKKSQARWLMCKLGCLDMALMLFFRCFDIWPLSCGKSKLDFFKYIYSRELN